MQFTLADKSTKAPSSFSYWVVPSRLLAGAYPGSPKPELHEAQVHTLVDAGIRSFVNLMEADEKDSHGKPFVPYHGVAAKRSPNAAMQRYAIRDLSIPTHATMIEILDAIDTSLANDIPVYVHCWGGVGRTGTVIGCWLLRHGLAKPSDVFQLIQELRKQDIDRGNRESPENDKQRDFVRQWLANGTRR